MPNTAKNNFLLFCKTIINAVIDIKTKQGGKTKHITTLKILKNYFLDQELLRTIPTVLKKSEDTSRKTRK